MQTLKSTGCVLDVRAAPGNTFVDVSRYHHTITNNNVVTVKGMGDALGGEYDGATAYLDCGNDASLNITDAITIEAWVKVNDIEDEYKTIVGNSPGIAEYNYWLLYRDNYIRFNIWGGEITTDNDVVTKTNNFYYIVTTAIKSSTSKIYVDGIEKKSGTAGSTYWTTTEVKIGAIRPASLFFFNGTISLVRIYNRALPAYEILDHYYEYATLLGLD